MDTDEGEGGEGWSSLSSSSFDNDDNEGRGLDQLAFPTTCGYFPTREDVERFVVEGEAESAPSA